MKLHHVLSIICSCFVWMLVNAPAFAQQSQNTSPQGNDAVKQNRMQSDFNTMTVLLNACEQRTMTPEQYHTSCTGLADALQQEGITNDEENAQIRAFVQSSTQRCKAIQNYSTQTEAANAAFRNGQITADTLRTLHDAALRILLDSKYITQETYAQSLAELDVQIAQYQQQTAVNPQQVQAPQTAANPQQVQTPQTAANPQQVQAPQTAANPQQVQAPQTAANPQQPPIPQTSYNPQQERTFQSAIVQQEEYSNQLMLVQHYKELYQQCINDYAQDIINDDEFRTRTAELFDTMMKVGIIAPQERVEYEAGREKLIEFKNKYLALWNGKTDDMAPKQWAEGIIALVDKAESEQVVSSELASFIRKDANDSRKYLEEYELLRTDYINDKISDDEYRNQRMVIFDGLVRTGYYAEKLREKDRANIEQHILVHNHWLTKEVHHLTQRIESGRMPIRRFEAEANASIDKAVAEGYPLDEATILRQELNSFVNKYHSKYDGANRRPSNFILKLGANGGGAYYSFNRVGYDTDVDSRGNPTIKGVSSISGDYWKEFAGGHIEFGYLWNVYYFSIGFFVRQDLNYVFDNPDSDFLGMTNAILRFAGVYYDSTLMLSFDIGMGGAYNGDDSTLSIPLALGLDYYVSDRVGIGIGFNAMYIMDLNDLTWILQPDLHIIIDI